MSLIIAGTFDNITHANIAKDSLLDLKGDSSNISLFHNNAPGQHDTFPVGGDEDKDPGSSKSHWTASGGAAVGAGIGLAAAVGGPVGVGAALGIGAYTGSLVGALTGTDENVQRRQAGVVVAVKVNDSVESNKAIKIFQESGAQVIERANGVIENGDWVDFNPLSVPHLVNKS